MLFYKKQQIKKFIYKNKIMPQAYYKTKPLFETAKPARYLVIKQFSDYTYFNRTLVDKTWGMKILAKVRSCYPPGTPPDLSYVSNYISVGSNEASGSSKQKIEFQAVGSTHYQARWRTATTLSYTGWQPINDWVLFEYRPFDASYSANYNMECYYDNIRVNTESGQPQVKSSAAANVPKVYIPHLTSSDPNVALLIKSIEFYNFGEPPFLKLEPVKAGDTIDGNTAASDGLYDYVSKTFTYKSNHNNEPLLIETD